MLLEKTPAIVVLAAGMGSRYGSLKQIDQFGPSGETIIDYSIHDAIKAGFKKVVFIIRKSIEEEFKEVFVNKFEDHIQIDYAFQEIDLIPDNIIIPTERMKPWGTGHAVLMAAEKIDQPFAVINADDFYGPKSFTLLYDHLISLNPENLDACLIGYRLKNTLSDHGYVSRGICTVSRDFYLQNVTERTHIYKNPDGDIYYVEDDRTFQLTGQELVSMNLLGFTPPFFKVLENGFRKFVEQNAKNPKSEYFLPNAVSSLVENYEVKIPVIETPELTYGVTYKEDKPIVKEMIRQAVQQGIYPKKLWRK